MEKRRFHRTLNNQCTVLNTYIVGFIGYQKMREDFSANQGFGLILLMQSVIIA